MREVVDRILDSIGRPFLRLRQEFCIVGYTWVEIT
jgi:hypothetical protein